MNKICSSCNQEIDPETCWCGNWIDSHSYWENHQPVPMGCMCHRLEDPEFGEWLTEGV